MAALLENDIAEAEFAEIAGNAEDITELEKTVDEQLNDIFMEFGGDSKDTTFKIKVARVIEGQGETEHCFYCLPPELPIIDRIQEEYGPGKYAITVYRNKVIFRRRKLNIAKPARQLLSVKAAASNSQDLASVMSAMAEANRVQMEQFKELMMMQRPAVQAAPAVDPMVMMTSMVSALSGLQGLMPKPAEANNMDMFLKGVELMKDFSGDAGGGREKGLYDMLIEAAKTFGGPIVEMAKSAAPMLPTGIPALPPGASVPPGTVLYPAPVQATEAVPPTAPVQPTASVQSIAPETTEKDEMGMIMRMQINNFVSQAMAGKDPALYADLILDNMSEIQINEFLGQPNLKEFLISVNPDVSKCWPWFEKLQTEVMAGLTNTENQDDTADIIETETPGLSTDATESKPNGDTASDT